MWIYTLYVWFRIVLNAAWNHSIVSEREDMGRVILLFHIPAYHYMGCSWSPGPHCVLKRERGCRESFFFFLDWGNWTVSIKSVMTTWVDVSKSPLLLMHPVLLLNWHPQINSLSISSEVLLQGHLFGITLHKTCVPYALFSRILIDLKGCLSTTSRTFLNSHGKLIFSQRHN